jgi:hypothetical protein
MPQNKKKQTEKAKQQECIEYFGRFGQTIIPHFMISFIPVIKRKKRLNYSCYPEEGHQSCYKHEHLPLADLGTREMAFCKNYADNQEDNWLHQLEKL